MCGVIHQCYFMIIVVTVVVMVMALVVVTEGQSVRGRALGAERYGQSVTGRAFGVLLLLLRHAPLLSPLLRCVRMGSVCSFGECATFPL